MMSKRERKRFNEMSDLKRLRTRVIYPLDAIIISIKTLQHALKTSAYLKSSKPKPIRHHLKPWKDPESLFCDREFLEKIGISVRRCEDMRK